MRRKVIDEICSSSADAIVISSENFAIADIAEVSNFFKRLPGDFIVKVVFFARSQDEVAESEYNQVVKLKRETRPFAEYIRDGLNGCDYMAVISEWERYFGLQNIICRIYDGSARNVVDQFLGCIPEIRADQISPFSDSGLAGAPNASIGTRALTAVRILNGIELNNRDHLYKEIFAQLVDSDLPALLFDSAQAREFRATFADCNRAFTGRFIGDSRADLGGRRYSDEIRDRIRKAIAEP